MSKKENVPLTPKQLGDRASGYFITAFVMFVMCLYLEGWLLIPGIIFISVGSSYYKDYKKAVPSPLRAPQSARKGPPWQDQ